MEPLGRPTRPPSDERRRISPRRRITQGLAELSALDEAGKMNRSPHPTRSRSITRRSEATTRASFVERYVRSGVEEGDRRAFVDVDRAARRSTPSFFRLHLDAPQFSTLSSARSRFCSLSFGLRVLRTSTGLRRSPSPTGRKKKKPPQHLDNPLDHRETRRAGEKEPKKEDKPPVATPPPPKKKKKNPFRLRGLRFGLGDRIFCVCSLSTVFSLLSAAWRNCSCVPSR